MIGERSEHHADADLFLKDPLSPNKSSTESNGNSGPAPTTVGSTALVLPVVGEPPATTASVYAQWARFVWLSLQRLGVRRADLDDVCHDVFIIVQRKLPEFDQRFKLQTWLFGICTRVAANYRRRAYIRKEDLAGGANDQEHVAAPESRRPDQQVEQSHSLSLAESILNRLSPVKRTVFVMFEIEGMNCPDIAKELGLPVGTVYSRLDGARKFFLAESARLRRVEGSQQ